MFQASCVVYQPHSISGLSGHDDARPDPPRRLGDREELLTRSRDILARNLRRIDEWVVRWNGRLAYQPPAAGGMVFVRYDFPINSTELSRLIRERESVFVVAGDWFGSDGHCCE